MKLTFSESLRAASATAEGLAVDWVGKKIYWSDVFSGQIMSMTTNKTHKTPLANVATPRAVAVHPCKGSVKLYMTIYCVPKIYLRKE